jgi:hypothetical protein
VPVTFAAFFAQGTAYQSSFFVLGGPIGLAVTASAQYGRDAAYRARAECSSGRKQKAGSSRLRRKTDVGGGNTSGD